MLAYNKPLILLLRDLGDLALHANAGSTCAVLQEAYARILKGGYEFAGGAGPPA